MFPSGVEYDSDVRCSKLYSSHLYFVLTLTLNDAGNKLLKMEKTVDWLQRISDIPSLLQVEGNSFTNGNTRSSVLLAHRPIKG